MKWIKVRFKYIITAGNYFHLVPHGVLLRVFFKTLGQKIKSVQGLNSSVHAGGPFFSLLFWLFMCEHREDGCCEPMCHNGSALS